MIFKELYSIKSRLFFWFILVSVIPLVIIGSFSYYMILEKIAHQNEETLTNINNGIYNMVDVQQKDLTIWLESGAAFAFSKLDDLGKSHFDYNNMVQIDGHLVPTWYIGKQKITNDFTIVDELNEKNKLGATFLQLIDNTFVRVSTNVRQADGARITGTTIETSSPVYKQLIKGQEYLGRANVGGAWGVTLYRPIFDEKNRLVGALVLGRYESEYYEIINIIKNIKVGETGYVFIMDPDGNAIVHPTMQGQNLLNNEWAREILQKKNGSITYKMDGREKIAYYRYYEPWNWYIVTGGYVSEIFNTTHKLSQLLLLAIFLVIGVSSLIAYALSTSFSRPIKELMKAMREAQGGNLAVRLTHTYDDEFLILSNALNVMLNNISLLIGRIQIISARLKEASIRLMVDISDAKQSLKGIENSLGNLQEHNLANSYAMNETFLQTIYQLEVALKGTTPEHENRELALNALEKIKSLYKRTFISPVNAEYLDAELSNDYLNKINSLNIEVQKLKLLLKNICSSASSLDEIALTLDRHINVFKISDDNQ